MPGPKGAASGGWVSLAAGGDGGLAAVRFLDGVEAESFVLDPGEAAEPFGLSPKTQSRLADFVGDGVVVAEGVVVGSVASALPAGRVIDIAELAALLFPALSQPVDGVGLPAAPEGALERAGWVGRLFLALCDRAQALPPPLLGEVARLLHVASSPLALAFPPAGEATVLASGKDDPVALVASLLSGEVEPGPLPIPQRHSLDGAALASLLSEDGPFARLLPAFERRPEQGSMMAAVALALDRGHHLVVEAGTGTGKSLAYLVPAAVFACRRRRAVVVSTYTRNLQEQLLAKDIPLVAEALEAAGLIPRGGLRVCCLKGKANYLCLARWAAFCASPALTPAEALFACRLWVWLASGPDGDRTHLHLAPGEADLWSRVSVEPGECPGEACAYHQRGLCFHRRARDRAEASHLVVVNHALLLADLARPEAVGVLPPYEYLVLDEAHHLEAVATQQLGFRVGRGDIARHAERLSRGLPEAVGRLRGVAAPVSSAVAGQVVSIVALAQRLPDRATDAFGSLTPFLDRGGEPAGNYVRSRRLDSDLLASSLWRQGQPSRENLVLALAELHRALGRLHGYLQAQAHSASAEPVLAELAGLTQTSGDLRHRVEALFLRPEPGWVYWVEGGDEARAACAAPLEVGPLLAERLFSRRETVVLTSATLAVGDDFSYLRSRLGLDQAEELRLGSSLDYEQAALVAIATDLPQPDHAGYPGTVSQVLAELARGAGGRTLALFTSYASLRAVAVSLRPALARHGLRVLAQGEDGTPESLVAALKARRDTVVLGAASLWEGIDVVGEALSLLAVARLPFAVPTDPVFAARSEGHPSPFFGYALPQAVLRFRQGFGRLIRSRHDRGVLVVLDGRIWHRRYGRAFLQALPRCRVEVGPWRELVPRIHHWLEEAATRG